MITYGEYLRYIDNNSITEDILTFEEYMFLVEKASELDFHLQELAEALENFDKEDE